jgi:lysozyme family protein
MEQFEYCFNKTMRNEGGFILHKNEGDRGGWTYAGIAENFWPDWKGWALVKSGKEDDPSLTGLVKEFYKKNFWDKMKLDEIDSQVICYNLFDFGVNAGWKTAAKLAQMTLGIAADGIIGPASIKELNDTDVKLFEVSYAIAKISRYSAIVRRNRSQERFLRGWIIRTLNVLGA